MMPDKDVAAEKKPEIKTVAELVEVVVEIGASMNDVIKSSETGTPPEIFRLKRILEKIQTKYHEEIAEKDARIAELERETKILRVVRDILLDNGRWTPKAEAEALKGKE